MKAALMVPIKGTTVSKRIDYTHYVKYKTKKYIRVETVMPKSFAWESSPKELIDFHTIKWNLFKSNSEWSEYYSYDKGWSKNGTLNKDNPIPEIEKLFKKTIGKDLVYV